MRAWRRIERAPEIGGAVFNSGAGHVNVSEMSDETKTTSPPTALDATQVRTMLPDPRRLSSNALGSVPEAQRYHERGLLGQGGMGEIMLVEDAAIGRDFPDGTHTLVHVPPVK